jgi:acetoin utilization deacetylase AcuC-like enzyme
MKTKIIFSPKCLKYGNPYRPENAPRVEAAAQILKITGYDFSEPKAAKDEDIFRVHDKAYVFER